jgi:peptide/nickel transport system permease protein
MATLAEPRLAGERATAARASARGERTFWRDTWRALRRDRGAMVGLGLVVLLVAAAVLAPLLAVYDPTVGYSKEGLNARGLPVPPFAAGPRGPFLLGTDGQGRDVLSRVLFGARISLAIGLVANTLAMLLGMLVGVIGGYARGLLGQAVMRLTDVVMAVPTLLFAMALVTVLRPGIGVVVVVIALAYWAYLARIVFGEVRSLREKEFVAAARCVGASDARIVVRHVLPNLVSLVVVYASLSAATMILTEATLSFLGIGVRPPTPSWGGMLSEGQQFFLTSPWMLLAPGAALLLTLLGFNLLGDGLRDALDPRRQSA